MKHMPLLLSQICPKTNGLKLHLLVDALITIHLSAFDIALITTYWSAFDAKFYLVWMIMLNFKP